MFEFQPIDFPTSLPTWPFPTFNPKPVDEPLPPRPRTGRRGAVAIAIGLVLGGLAFAFWRKKRLEKRDEAVPAPAWSAPVPVSAPAPTPQPLWLPRTAAEIEQLAETTRTWMRLVPHADDHELARVVWGFHWRGVPFPQPSHDAECPPALALLERIIAAVRADDAESASDTGADADEPTRDPRADEPLAPTSEASVRDTPTPGSFYRVRHDDELLGAAGIAARAVGEATKNAARRRGWSAERADARATRLASKPSVQAAYAELIQRSEYNRDGVEGERLWLPPLRTSGLLDRDRRRPVVLDARPWPDGSSRLEPPPTTHPTPLADGAEQTRESDRECVNVELRLCVPEAANC